MKQSEKRFTMKIKSTFTCAFLTIYCIKETGIRASFWHAWSSTLNRLGLTISTRSCSQKQPSRGVVRKSCCENRLQIYRRTPMSQCDFSTVALQLYWNHTSARVFSCMSAAYFHTFLYEHLWRAASVAIANWFIIPTGTNNQLHLIFFSYVIRNKLQKERLSKSS